MGVPGFRHGENPREGPTAPRTLNFPSPQIFRSRHGVGIGKSNVENTLQRIRSAVSGMLFSSDMPLAFCLTFPAPYRLPRLLCRCRTPVHRDLQKKRLRRRITRLVSPNGMRNPGVRRFFRSGLHLAFVMVDDGRYE